MMISDVICDVNDIVQFAIYGVIITIYIMNMNKRKQS